MTAAIDFDNPDLTQDAPLRSARLAPSKRTTRTQREHAEGGSHFRFGDSDDSAPLVDHAADSHRPATVAEIRADRSHMVTGWQVHCPRQSINSRCASYGMPSAQGYDFLPYERRPLDPTCAPQLFGEAAVQLLIRERWTQCMDDLEQLESRMDSAADAPIFEQRKKELESALSQADGTWRQIEHILQLLELIDITTDIGIAPPKYTNFRQWRAAQFKRIALRQQEREKRKPIYAVEDQRAA